MRSKNQRKKEDELMAKVFARMSADQQQAWLEMWRQQYAMYLNGQCSPEENETWERAIKEKNQ